jgi:N-succinyldiaminopimelate aminotransferase
MRSCADRLQGIPPTIFAEMSDLAVRTGALNLGQGFPDTDGPPSVIAQAVQALRHGRNQYAPGIGIPELRAAVAEHQTRHYGLELDPDCQVVITTGCTEAIAGAILGLVNPGDEVIVLEPYYDSYLAMIQMAGGIRVPITLRAPDFRVDLDAMRTAITPRTRVMLINSPHNPTGSVLNEAERNGISALALEHDLTVITDEVYEHLTYEGAQHVPLATLPGMFERTLTLSSAGKSYSFTGWKVGWATGPTELVRSVMLAKQWLSYTSGSPLQPAIAHALTQEPEYPQQLAASLQVRRDLLCAGLADVGLPATTPQGTYFASTDISPLGWPSGYDFCVALPERAGVVAIPMSAFYDNQEAGAQLVRWAFCKDSEVIAEGVRRLATADLSY